MSKRVVVAGSSGLIGSALRRSLADRGDQVVRLVRREPGSADEVRWDPASGHLDESVLRDADAVVNLAGVGIGDRRWNAEHKRAIEESRLGATSTIADAIAAEHDRSGRKVRLVNASAVGYYGDRKDEVLTEASRPGHDFLTELVTRWERAARPASDAHAPVAFVRSGLVMAREGGAFEPLLRLARLGLGGPMGSGDMWWPWISLVDEVRAILHLVDHPDLVGPFNLVAPDQVRQREIASALGHALHRPAVLPAPTFALRLVIGEFADYVLASQRVVPERLVESGFVFEHPDLEDAVRWLAGR